MKNAGMVANRGVFAANIAAVAIPFLLLHLHVFDAKALALWTGRLATLSFYIVMILAVITVALSEQMGFQELKLRLYEKNLFRVCEWVYFKGESEEKRTLAIAVMSVIPTFCFVFGAGIGFGFCRIFIFRD
jgi:hypothetical protein